MDKFFKNILVKRGKRIDTSKMSRGLSWMKHIIDERKRLCDLLRHDLEEVERCPICSCALNSLFVDIHGYPYVECSNCGHIYMQKQPVMKSLEEFYSGMGEGKTIQGEIYIDDDIFKERVKQIALPKVSFCLENMNVNGKWIDCGCGTGELLVALSSFDIDCAGIETDVEEINFARNQGVKVEQENIYTVKESVFKGAQVVSMINILEHLKYPSQILKKVSSYLSKEAYLIIEVPRHPSLSSYNSLAFPDLTYRHLYAPDHLHIFTEYSLKIMLREAGLKEKAVWQFGQDFMDFVCISSINNNLEDNEFVNKIMSLFSSVFDDAQQSIDDRGFSDTMFVIAQKI
jgi:2-polyprenyl-3-methyl-5-hydroxy-6-metoxy-1,4-benzoquinol methylase